MSQLVFFLIFFLITMACGPTAIALGTCESLFEAENPAQVRTFVSSRDKVERKLPPRLYRLIKGEPEFSQQGFLVSHSQLDNKLFWNTDLVQQSETVPMVSKSDVEHVARFLFSPEAVKVAMRPSMVEEGHKPPKLYLLEIDPLQISGVDARKMPLLEDVEYFGFVSRASILSIRELSFEPLPPGGAVQMSATAPPMLNRSYERTATLQLVIKP